MCFMYIYSKHIDWSLSVTLSELMNSWIATEMWKTSSSSFASVVSPHMFPVVSVAFVLVFRTQKPFCLTGCWSVGRICATVRTARRKHKHVILSLEKTLSCTMPPFCSHRDASIRFVFGFLSRWILLPPFSKRWFLISVMKSVYFWSNATHFSTSYGSLDT